MFPEAVTETSASEELEAVTLPASQHQGKQTRRKGINPIFILLTT